MSTTPPDRIIDIWGPRTPHAGPGWPTRLDANLTEEPDRWVQAALTVQGKIGNWDLTYAGAYMDRKRHTLSDYTDYAEAYDALYADYGGLAGYFYYQDNAGNTILPLQHIDGSDHFREAFKARVLPRVADFRPDVIIISAGFDAHHRDPLAQINLVADDFDWATGKLMDLSEKSANNRVVSLLEGGYDLQGLAESAATHIYRLMRG